MNVIAVHDGLKAAAEQAKKDKTPILVDIKTYRYKGHSMSDPAKYRTRDELEAYQKQDPILVLKAVMAEAKMLDDDEYKKIDDDAKEVVQDAVDFAESSDEPALETMYEDIYV
jgi:pyruvate dehydrogenase E1 component alpha subunit